MGHRKLCNPDRYEYVSSHLGSIQHVLKLISDCEKGCPTQMRLTRCEIETHLRKYSKAMIAIVLLDLVERGDVVPVAEYRPDIQGYVTVWRLVT